MTNNRYESKTFTNLDKDAQGDDNLEFVAGEAIFGMTRSDIHYQSDQRHAEKELERRRVEAEAELVSSFRASSSRRSNAPPVIAKPLKHMTPDACIGLQNPVRIVPHKKRQANEASAPIGSSAAKKSKSDKVLSDVNSAAAPTVDVVASLFDYPSEDESI